MAEEFDAFVAARLPALLRLAGVLAGDRGTAEDVVQDVLAKASQRWLVISASGAADAYLRRMVVNEYVSWRRKWSRIVPRAVIAEHRQVPDHAERHAERDDLARRLDRLPPRQRSVLVLRYYEGLADEQIAEILQCSPGTVRSHASRALSALRIEMGAAASETSRSVAEAREEPRHANS